jgi:hypothetical protein
MNADLKLAQNFDYGLPKTWLITVLDKSVLIRSASEKSVGVL